MVDVPGVARRCEPPLTAASAPVEVSVSASRGSDALAKHASPRSPHAPAPLRLRRLLSPRLSRSPFRPVAQEDTGPTTPTFKEGDVIGVDKIDSLKPFLPPEFWSNRDFFFYEGMKLEIGPFYRDYAPRRRLPGRDDEVRGPGEDRPRREPRGLHRRPALPDGQDRLQGRSAGRRQDHLELRLPVGGRRRAGPVLLLLLGPRRGAAALLRGHREDRPDVAPRRARVPRRTAATSSAARSGRPRSASRSTRRSTRAASSS